MSRDLCCSILACDFLYNGHRPTCHFLFFESTPDDILDHAGLVSEYCSSCLVYLDLDIWFDIVLQRRGYGSFRHTHSESSGTQNLVSRSHDDGNVQTIRRDIIRFDSANTGKFPGINVPFGVIRIMYLAIHELVGLDPTTLSVQIRMSLVKYVPSRQAHERMSVTLIIEAAIS